MRFIMRVAVCIDLPALVILLFLSVIKMLTAHESIGECTILLML